MWVWGGFAPPRRTAACLFTCDFLVGCGTLARRADTWLAAWMWVVGTTGTGQWCAGCCLLALCCYSPPPLVSNSTWIGKDSTVCSFTLVLAHCHHHTTGLIWIQICTEHAAARCTRHQDRRIFSRGGRGVWAWRQSVCWPSCCKTFAGTELHLLLKIKQLHSWWAV